MLLFCCLGLIACNSALVVIPLYLPLTYKQVLFTLFTLSLSVWVRGIRLGEFFRRIWDIMMHGMVMI